MIPYDFAPDFFVKFVVLQQLYCLKYNRAVGSTPYRKRHIPRTKLGHPLRSAVYLTLTLIFFELQLDHEKVRLDLFVSRNALQVFWSFCSPQPIKLQYVAWLMLYGRLGLASVGM